MRVRSLLHQLRQGSSLSQESLMCVTWLTSWEMACVLEMMLVTTQHCLSSMSPLTWCPRCCPCRRRSTSGGGRTALSPQTGSVPSVEAFFSSPSHCTGSLCLWSVWSSLAWPDLAVRRKPSGQRVTCRVDVLVSKVLLTTLTRLSWQGRFR